MKKHYLIILIFALISCKTEPKKVTTQTIKHKKYLLDGIHRNPGEALPETKFYSPDFLKSMGYNGQVINDFVSPFTTIDYENFEPGLFPSNEEEKQWIETHRKKTHSKIKEAHKSGLELYYWSDLFVTPVNLYKKYKNDLVSIAQNDDTFEAFDINQPLNQRLIKYMIKEVFDEYADLDGLVIRIGEIYTLDAPYHTGGKLCHSPDDYKVLINILREEVCVKRNKKIFFRTWGFDGFHTDPDYYLKVTDAIEPHENLIFSIKHNRYHRMNPFSSVLTLGKHPQIIEYSCQRSFEGKGAYPNYVAKGLIEGFEEYHLMDSTANKSLQDIIDHPNIAGLWSWSRGDGWAGPYLKNELWPELNAYVAAKWFQDPTQSEKDLIDTFAKNKGLKGNDIETFRKIAWLSADAVLRGREKYKGETEVNYDMPGRLWMRDHFMEGDDGNFKPLRDKIIAQDHVEMALQEKAEAIQIWKQIVDLSKQLTTQDEELKEFIVTSSTYGLINYSIIEQFWTISLLGRQGELSGKTDTKRIVEAIKKYDQLWLDWKALKASSPSCATLLKDVGFTCYLVPNRPGTGMGVTVEKYRTKFM